jgi:hypothetical protein
VRAVERFEFADQDPQALDGEDLPLSLARCHWPAECVARPGLIESLRPAVLRLLTERRAGGHWVLPVLLPGRASARGEAESSSDFLVAPGRPIAAYADRWVPRRHRSVKAGSRHLISRQVFEEFLGEG